MRKVLKNKTVLKRCKIYRMLLENKNKRHFSFHTPGHKNAKWDITELSYSDNLSAAKGCLKEAEEDVAAILGAKRSFILTDGSTSGVFSMLHAAKTLGVNKVLASVETHKSFFNGCALLGLSPLLLPAKRVNGIPAPYTFTEIETQFPSLLSEADAIFLTSPDYYGNTTDWLGFSAYCKKEGKILLADGAHGGHLHFDKGLYAGQYADIWVDGVHKSLPAFTQGAVVSAHLENTEKALKNAVDIFRTTSPSYPIMPSVEYAVKYPQNQVLEKMVRAYAQENQQRIYLAEDWTKLCVLFGKRAFDVEKEVEKMGLFPEFCDGNVLMFYLSPATSIKEFCVLKKTLKGLFAKYPYELPKDNKMEENAIQPIPAPLVFDEKGTEWVKFNEADGRICARICGLFPPCTPLFCIGERITADKLELLKNANNVFGIENASILVYKLEE